MHALRTIAICLAVGTAYPVLADPAAEFTAAFNGYREAVDASEFRKAAEYAEKARQLGEEVYPDDVKVQATLAWNHGFALSKAYYKVKAYETLKEARTLMAQAFGGDYEHLVQVETLLLNNAPEAAARRHLSELLKLARRHYDEDSDSDGGTETDGGQPGLVGPAREGLARRGRGRRLRNWASPSDRRRRSSGSARSSSATTSTGTRPRR